MRLFLLGILVLATGCSRSGNTPIRPTDDGAALAQASSGWRLTLVDEWGRELPSYQDGSAAWFEGAQGQSYRVRVQNQTAKRIEVVMTVDGRDVVSGKIGDFSAQRGYIVDPYDTLDVEGFRTSDRDVATFRFTHPGDAYSARMGSAEHIGVVGVAVFTEDQPPVAYRAAPSVRGGAVFDESEPAPMEDKAESSSAKDSTRSAPASPRRSNIGTQYGEQRQSSVVQVEFKRSSDRPETVLAVYYDDRQGLQARGLLPTPPARVAGPQPFPNNQYAPAPPGR